MPPAMAKCRCVCHRRCTEYTAAGRTLFDKQGANELHKERFLLAGISHATRLKKRRAAIPPGAFLLHCLYYNTLFLCCLALFFVVRNISYTNVIKLYIRSAVFRDFQARGCAAYAPSCKICRAPMLPDRLTHACRRPRSVPKIHPPAAAPAYL